MRISDWSSDVCSSDLRPYRSNGMPAFAVMTIIELPPAQLQAALHDGAAGLERRSPGGGTTLQRHGSDPAVAQGEGCIAVTVIIEGGGAAVGRRAAQPGIGGGRRTGLAEIAPDLVAALAVLRCRLAGAELELRGGQAGQFLWRAFGRQLQVGGAGGEQQWQGKQGDLAHGGNSAATRSCPQAPVLSPCRLSARPDGHKPEETPENEDCPMAATVTVDRQSKRLNSSP